MALGLSVSGPALAADACSIEAYGRPSYERVKKKIEDQFYKSPDLTVEPYEKAEITLLPDCVLELHGRFTAKERGRLKHKFYEARATPKEGAPLGIKILKFKVDNG